MGLPRAAWVKLNRLRTGAGRFHLSMHKWGLAPSPNCECGASEQTADHVLTACPIYRAPHGARGLTVLDKKTWCWLNNTTSSNVPSKSLLSVRGMKGCVSSGEYYLRQGSFGFLSQNAGVL